MVVSRLARSQVDANLTSTPHDGRMVPEPWVLAALVVAVALLVELSRRDDDPDEDA